MPRITPVPNALQRLRKALVTDEQEAISALTAQLDNAELAEGKAALTDVFAQPHQRSDITYKPFCFSITHGRNPGWDRNCKRENTQTPR